MSRQLRLALAMVCTIAAPAWAETAPTDVVFDDGAVPQSLTGTPGDADEGVRVMTTNALGNCVACHMVGALPDVEFQGNIAPPLDGAGDRWSEAELRGIVVDAKMMFPGSFMPGFYKTEGFIRPGDAYTGRASEGAPPPVLTAQQVEDVVAYLTTLKD